MFGANFQRKYALTDQGVQNTKKGTFWTVVVNLVVMGGVSILYLVMSGLMKTLTDGAALPAALPVLAGLVIFALLSFLTHFQQYKATYGLVYGEVKATRLRLAERLRKLPLGFFGKRDLADLTETLMGDVNRMEHVWSHVLMENIRLGRRGASDAEVMAAAKAANCEEFVNKLPQGYQTPIGENGAKLSGGERQRISIARALLKDAPIVLLDEATASLDVENETKVQGALSRLLTGKTVLVIAHRMRTVAGADHIVVLKDGRVEQQGSPKELMAEGGLFRHMVELQSQSSQWQLSGVKA